VQLGVGQEHVHAATYFATRILYQRGKLDMSGVVARLNELLKACPDFPEAEAMLSAARRGTLRPDRRGFQEATVPPGAALVAPAPSSPRERNDGDDDDRERVTASSDIPTLEARIKTPRAPGIPRAPALPRFTPRENIAPSYVPIAEPAPSSAELSLTLEPPVPISNPWNQPPSAPPPPSSSQRGRLRLDSPVDIAIDLAPFDAVVPAGLGDRTTAPSPGAPGPSAAAPPTVFAIATWLSERDFERALAALEKLGPDSTPELSLLEVRALSGLGRKAAARRSLERLCRAPLLDPELRAAVARLLIELGDLDRAEAQARRAHTEDPGSELSRLTLAWAIARSSAWLPSPRSVAELSELLRDFIPEAGALPALGYALCALKLLPASPAAARQAADAALALDADSQDALAIAAVVAQKHERGHDARRLYQRLLDVDHRAAEELAATLARLDLDVGREAEEPAPGHVTPTLSGRAAPTRPAMPAKVLASTEPPAPADTSPWDEKEQRLALGDSRAALFDFEQGLSRKLEVLSARAGASELSAAAMISARYLTEAPVSRHFAPFDLSLFSIARLDVALGLLYRGGVGRRTELRTRVLMGLGAYLGECLRQAYAGEWLGASVDLLRMHVEGQGLCFSPFRDMNARLQSAEPLDVGDTPLPPHPGAEPLGQRVALSIAPPSPWDPAPWPDVSRLPELGVQLRKSPVGLYCAGIEVPLDLSFASLRSLDRYVTLLAPPLAPSDPEAAWVRRASVLVGAYLGEVMRATRGGDWEPTRGELRPESYRVSLPGGIKALPVACAFERLSGRRLEQPSDYARRITG
jgi:tetratricopeptide (TPR) repeat protein